MDNNKTPLQLYREKKDEVHTPEEIKVAFEDSYAICFQIAKGHAGAKQVLFGKIWQANPDTIITKVDLCVMSRCPFVLRDQFLFINRNGTGETLDQIRQLTAKSGLFHEAYCFFAEKKNGIKRCIRSVLGSEKPAVVHKGNLLIDGDKLLLTIR